MSNRAPSTLIFHRFRTGRTRYNIYTNSNGTFSCYKMFLLLEGRKIHDAVYALTNSKKISFLNDLLMIFILLSSDTMFTGKPEFDIDHETESCASTYHTTSAPLTRKDHRTVPMKTVFSVCCIYIDSRQARSTVSRKQNAH